MFRATVSTDRSSYRTGDTVQASARFENVSGRACTYTGASASSQVLDPSGQPVTPPRTLTAGNPEMFPFEPGTPQTFQASWPVLGCGAASTCFPGRYTIVFEVTPFGTGQATFDVV